MRSNIFKLAALALTTVAIGFAAPANADTSVGSDDGYQSSESDTFSGSGGLNPFDLIHQAQRGDVRSMGEFTADAQTNIKNASLDFRAQQQLLLLQMLQQQSNTQSTIEAEAVETQGDGVVTESALTEETSPAIVEIVETETFMQDQFSNDEDL